MSVYRDEARRSRKLRDGSNLCRITERDRRIITTVALHGAASRGQLVALGHFSSTSRANRRLRQLFDGRYLRRTHVATGPNAVQTVYILGPEGSALVAEETGLDPIEWARQGRRQPERMFLEHHLAALSVRLAALNPPPDVRVDLWLTEPECRHEYWLGNGREATRRIIKPDAFAIVELAGTSVPLFIEVDRGHVSLPQMTGVFDRYDRYFHDGAFQAAYGLDDPFQVLVITTAGDRRISHLASLAKRSRVAVRFATFNDLHRLGFFGRIWRREAGTACEHLWESAPEGSTGDRL